jgi:hypothetical protein
MIRPHDRGVPERCEQVTHATLDPGDDGVGRHFGEWTQHEHAFGEARVRDAQTRLVDDRVTEHEEIEVECPRAPPLLARPIPAAIGLDREQRVEQGPRFVAP